MGCHMESSFEDFVVPMRQQSFDVLASPDAWSKWCINSPEAPEKCFIMDGFDLMNNEFRCLSEQTNGLNVHGDFCNGSSLQEPRDDHCQLHDFDGIGQMDEIFLNSILEDLPQSGSLQTSVCSVSSSSGLKLKPNDEIILADFGVDTQQSVSYRINNSSAKFSEDSSLDEFVLQDLQTLVEKLTDKTRICFRDTFYRLAKNSQQKSVSPGSNAEDFAMETPCTRWCDEQGETTSWRRTDQETEPETNKIDRAIASLTFKKMESNMCEFPLPAKASS